MTKMHAETTTHLIGRVDGGAARAHLGDALEHGYVLVEAARRVRQQFFELPIAHKNYRSIAHLLALLQVHLGDGRGRRQVGSVDASALVQGVRALVPDALLLRHVHLCAVRAHEAVRPDDYRHRVR